jgi:uncharacterized protein (TIGR02246 family)
MKKRMAMVKALATLLLAILMGCAAQGEHRGSANERQRVADAASGWAAAFNSRDPARIAAFYEKDAVLWGTTSPVIRTTPEQIYDYFKDSPKRPDARVAIIDQVIRIDGDMAFSSGSYIFTDVRDGKPVSNPSRFTFVFRLRDGQWRLVHHHSSRMPSP